MKTIAIIGAGVSGTLVAINLLQTNRQHPIRICLIEKSGNIGPGLAYSTSEAAHLLNIEAGDMSIFLDKPGHFTDWLRERHLLFSPQDFVPRNIYRRYLQEVFEATVASHATSTSVELIAEEAIDLFIRENQAIIILKNGEKLFCDKVVLAMGNFPPANLALPDCSYEKDSRYFQNPWSENAFQQLAKEATVLLIGTGLTMIDMVLALHQQQHRGQIVAVSTYGVLPQIHKATPAYPSFFEEIKQAEDLIAMISIVKKHLRHARTLGLDWRAVVDALRPDMQKIWFLLSLSDKKRFLRHIGHRWGVVRHRMPQDAAAIIAHMQERGQLQVIAGTITHLLPVPEGINVTYTTRKTKQEIHLLAQRVLNCTGPESNIEQIVCPLIHNMLAGGLLRSDPLQLGACTTPEGALITRGGNRLDQVYTLGPAMKGILWECVAVPEIRQQARNLAKLLV